MNKIELAKFIRKLFSSVYSPYMNNNYLYSEELIKYLELRPELTSEANTIFSLRDEFMLPENYDIRWDMGDYLMKYFKIEFEHSEGSELIFCLCLAIHRTFLLSWDDVGEHLSKDLDIID